ncbi:hypothetical protein QM806_04480 [Rhodococcus sp. IEGM 1351]|uniref:hypothetical protein n=1 Tax=Rhodococcus sp. IEGM 1351 TaxID=3047089 RepID=UPI0024B6CFA2|nr:hypothetical protein [Rhodococcus sp. IEGM 1351]MDI9934711.1 hypothetical protein [Rhodococcus sp. IEGM 1351]
MERKTTKRRYEKAEVPAELAEATNTELLEQVINMPGELGDTYTRFINLSLGNQALLMMQNVFEPVNTFRRWGEDFGRDVKKGARAKYIRRPLFKKEVNEQGKEEEKLIGFKLVKCMFGVSDTEGDPLPEYEAPEWSQSRARQNLNITEVPFEELDGNVQGFSYARNLAINPVAAFPLKTWLHEASHIEAGHTGPGSHEEYLTHRGEKEFEAETSAYILMHRLGALALFNAAESRNYVQSWMRNKKPTPESSGRVLRVSERILKAGRETDTAE